MLQDVRTDYQVAGVEPLGPDLAVYSGFTGELTNQGTFLVASMGARPELVVEVTSPSTRNNDLSDKVVLYFQVGVPLYAIVDYREDWGEVEVIGYQATPAGYVRMQPGARGRLWLAPVRLWLAGEGNRVVCYDEHGKRIPDYDESRQETQEEARARRQAEADKAKAEARSAEDARARQQAEADKADLAARLRQLEAERAKAEADTAARRQQLEAELRRLRGES
jgi:hypothetical protein